MKKHSNQEQHWKAFASNFEREDENVFDRKDYLIAVWC